MTSNVEDLLNTEDANTSDDLWLGPWVVEEDLLLVNYIVVHWEYRLIPHKYRLIPHKYHITPHRNHPITIISEYDIISNAWYLTSITLIPHMNHLIPTDIIT